MDYPKDPEPQNPDLIHAKFHTDSITDSWENPEEEPMLPTHAFSEIFWARTYLKEIKRDTLIDGDKEIYDKCMEKVDIYFENAKKYPRDLEELCKNDEKFSKEFGLTYGKK